MSPASLRGRLEVVSVVLNHAGRDLAVPLHQSTIPPSIHPTNHLSIHPTNHPSIRRFIHSSTAPSSSEPARTLKWATPSGQGNGQAQHARCKGCIPSCAPTRASLHVPPPGHPFMCPPPPCPSPLPTSLPPPYSLPPPQPPLSCLEQPRDGLQPPTTTDGDGDGGGQGSRGVGDGERAGEQSCRGWGQGSGAEV